MRARRARDGVSAHSGTPRRRPASPGRRSPARGPGTAPWTRTTRTRVLPLPRTRRTWRGRRSGPRRRARTGARPSPARWLPPGRHRATAPVALSYEPTSTWSTPWPIPSGEGAPVPGKGPGTAPSGARASRPSAARPPLTPSTRSSPPRSRVGARADGGNRRGGLRVDQARGSGVPRVVRPRRTVRQVASHDFHPDAAPLASPRAPLTSTRCDSRRRLRHHHAARAALPRWRRTTRSRSPGSAARRPSASPPSTASRDPRPADAGSPIASASRPRRVEARLGFGSIDAGCDRGTPPRRPVARVACAPSVSHETPTHVSLTAPASARACARDGDESATRRRRCIGVVAHVGEDTAVSGGSRVVQRHIRATVRATVTRDGARRDTSMERSRTREGGGGGTRAVSEKTSADHCAVVSTRFVRPRVAGSYRHRREHRERGPTAVACHRATREGRAGLGEPGPTPSVELDAIGPAPAATQATRAVPSPTRRPARARTTRRHLPTVTASGALRGLRAVADEETAFVARSASLWRHEIAGCFNCLSRRPVSVVTAHKGKTESRLRNIRATS